MQDQDMFPTYADIETARVRLQTVTQVTPLDYSMTLSNLAGSRISLKLENLQKTGSFKLRGAYNKLCTLTDHNQVEGVIAASAGNHAQGVAYAASLKDVPCTIVMPENASLAKISATEGYGAEVVLAGSSYDEAYAYARQLQETRGLTYVHAFDDPAIVAGQGTIGLEIVDQLPSVNAIVVPMGGGGLAAGVAMAVKTIRPDIRVIGVEAAAAACFRGSLDSGTVTTVPLSPTVADGIAVKRPGEVTFALVQKYVDDVVTVEEEEITRSMVLLLERSKLVAEGAAAAAVAAAVYRKIPTDLGDTVIILSGGNIDVTVLSKVIEHGLTEAGRYLQIAALIPDRPGALGGLLDVIAKLGANVVTIAHQRVGPGIAFGQTKIEIDLETRDKRHIADVFETLRKKGYQPTERA